MVASGQESSVAAAASGATAAASDEEESASTVEEVDFMEQYTQGVSAVETILALDRLRQSVAVKELLRNSCGVRPPATAAASSTVQQQQQQQQPQSQFMRKTVSVPNFSHVSATLPVNFRSYILN